MKYQKRLKTISKINTPQLNIFDSGGDVSSSSFGKNEVVLGNGSSTTATSKEWYGDTSVENPDSSPLYYGANRPITSNSQTNNNTQKEQKDNSGLAGGIMAATGSLNQLIGNMLDQASIKDPEAMKDNYRAQLGGLDTSSFDALNASKKAKIADVSASDFTNMTKGAGVLNGISSGDVGATAGNAIVPGWGALVGGVLGTGTSIIGTIRGRRKARRAVKPMNDFIKEINTLNNMNFVNQNNNLAANQVSSLEANYKAEGGFLNMGNNKYKSIKHTIDNQDTLRMTPSEAEYFTNHYKNYYPGFNAYRDTGIPVSYSYGGQMGKHSNDFSNGLVSINNGGSHEMNPNQGVQIGVDNQGTPNLVEEGETVFGDFVFSNRITVPKEVLSSFGIKTRKKMTYADVSKYLAKESEERPNDQISQRGLERNLGLLSDAQEKQKIQKKAEERMLQAINAVNPDMPADPMMAMQGEEQMQEEQMAQDQMAQEQVMQEQAMQEQAMQEQVAQQGGQPMMGAYGGFLKNCYAEGTNAKNTISEKDIYYSNPRYGNNDSFDSEMYNYGVVTPTTSDSFFFRPFPNGYIAPYSDKPDLEEDYGWTNPTYKAATEAPSPGIDWSATVAKNAVGYIPIVGTAIDTYDMIKNPSWYNAASLGISAVGDLAYGLGPITGGLTIPAAQVAKTAALARRAKRIIKGSSARVKLNKKVSDLYLKPYRFDLPDVVKNDSVEYTLPQSSFVGTPVDATRHYIAHPTDYTNVNIKAKGGNMNSNVVILSYDDGEDANLYSNGTSALNRNAYYDFMRKVGMSKKNRKYFESLEDKVLREKLMAWVAGQQQNNNPYGASILDWTKKYFPSWYDEDTKASETADIAQTAAQDNASGELLPSKPQWDISNLNTAIPQATATNSYAYTPFTMDQMQGDVYASKYNSVEELENSAEFKTWTNELITNPSAHYDWIEVILSKIPDGQAIHKELKPDGIHWATDSVLSKRISELRNDHKLGPFHFSGSTLVYDPKVNTLPMQKVLNPYDRYFMKTEDGTYKLVKDNDPVLYLKNLNKGYMKVDERKRLVTKDDDGGTDYYYDPNSAEPMKMTPGEFLRFMPALASGAAFITDGLGITNVPNYEFADPLVDIAAQRSAPAYWNPIGDYLPYKPVDKNFAINQMNAEANANRRALMDVHAGNRGSASGALIMANDNYLKNIGDFTVTADEQNWTKLKDKSEFNKDTNYKNADGFMRAMQSNQSQFNQDFNNYMSALKLKQDIYNNSENIKATNAQNFFNTLGEIGKEIQDKNMAKRTANAGTYGPGAEQFLQGFIKYAKSWDENGNRKDNSKAYGGKFKRRR